MQGAIVCFAMQKCRFSGLRKAYVERLSLPMGGGEVAVYTLPCAEEQFLQWSGDRQCALLRRCAQQMEKNGIVCVYPENALLPFFKGNFYIPDGRRIFSHYAGQIIERHIQTFALSIEDTEVFICETPFTAVGASVASFMAMHTKKLHLISKDISGAQRIAKTLFEDYGLTANVEKKEKLMNKADIALLLTVPEHEILSSGLIIDFTGRYPHSARKDLEFETAFGFVSFLKYFGRADCRSAEFLLCCFGAETEENADAALQRISWRPRCL